MLGFFDGIDGSEKKIRIQTLELIFFFFSERVTVFFFLNRNSAGIFFGTVAGIFFETKRVDGMISETENPSTLSFSLYYLIIISINKKISFHFFTISRN